jgi:hypothetical protein
MVAIQDWQSAGLIRPSVLKLVLAALTWLVTAIRIMSGRWRW